MARIVIQSYVPDVVDPDGLPKLELPPADGRIKSTFIGRTVYINGWGEETVRQLCRDYAKAALAAANPGSTS